MTKLISITEKHVAQYEQDLRRLYHDLQKLHEVYAQASLNLRRSNAAIYGAQMMKDGLQETMAMMELISDMLLDPRAHLEMCVAKLSQQTYH